MDSQSNTQFFYHIVKNNSVVMSNLPNELLSEVESCLAESKLVYCNVRKVDKRQKKLPIDNGFVYLCTYDKSVTKNDFKKYFDILLSLIPSFDEAVNRAASPSFDLVKKIRHNVYDQLSHILDDMKSISAIDDIPSKDWNDIVDYSRDKIFSNTDKAAKAVLRSIKRTAIALSEFDAYEIIISSAKPQLQSHSIHKVIKLSIQPYLIDFWDKGIKINFGECYDKVQIDYELINLSMGHFWNNATKYALPNSDISISFSPNGREIIVTITMTSLAIRPEEINSIFKMGESGFYAKKARLDGNGLGMYYIQECINRSHCTFTVIPGDSIKNKNKGDYATNAFRFSFPKA